MAEYPSWQYDEMQQIGKDYNSLAEVEVYDARHGRFRNVEKENEDILKRLDLRSDHVLIDFGSGTGAFAIQAARLCARVYAVDISRAMLEYAEMKAVKAGIRNVTFCHGGFLTYKHAAQPVDAVVTNTAFHHLPDFWKGMALRRMNRMLKTGGQLYLSDVILEQRNVRKNIERFVAKLEAIAGLDIRKDVEAHIRQEYSTYDWIMDGLLERSGFAIVSKVIQEGVIGRYVCRKKVECAC
jgi:putative AdoMet-dependent methyltransferase